MKNAYVRKLMEMEGPTNEARSSLDLRRTATQQQGGKRRNETPESKKEAPKLTAQQIANRAAYDRGEHPKKPQEENTAYQRLGVLMAEALGLVESEFPKGPTAKRYDSLGKAKDTNGGTAAIKDPLVKRETEKTKANIDKKTQSDTNPNVSDLVQGSMNRRRGESRRGKGPQGLPAETPKEAKADAEHSRKKVQDAGDR